ncbi:DUF222 domain-containing protein [Mycobacterium hodleri]|uniref:HNH endonuclease signature motif containing protein n=1 Tax=Mycolicibacterium hodleri TaxID=49897 RepID=UPI0021F29222|nr:HNH endonuclease signature motif containing protein [Mycolicibacterium hodleri]MCV7136875.1 DUF222 domain-containing protein [Mycolicibacterium hodleri]
MFDDLVDATTGTRGAGALSSWSRVENAACACRVATMAAMLDEAYALSGSADRDQWCLDDFDAVAAHIGAAQNITPGAASHQLLVAIALHERFPRVAAVFAEGLITHALVKTVVQRGALVIDPDALRALDHLLAQAFGDWEPRSVDKTEKAIDFFVGQVDPQAVRRAETKARGRSVEVHIEEDGSGLATVLATLFAHDAKVFEARLKNLAATVCPADPRTADQLRADAYGAIGNGTDRMACLCGNDDCAAIDGEKPPLFDKPLRDLTLTEVMTPTPGRFAKLRPAASTGGQFLPGAVACRAAIGATITQVVHPGQAPPENRYRPSKKLADFIRCRDMTCRFPGCRVPASQTDVDHTIPWPHGPTAASNLKCICRRHHLLKTFWGGENCWRERQLDDGTVIWTAPDGREYITTPGSRLLFPELSAPTATITTTGRPVPHTAGLAMPRRKVTRVEGHVRAIHRERNANEQSVGEDGPGP